MSILDRGGDPDSSWPIVIGVAEHKADALERVHGHPELGVIDHVEAHGVDGTLADGLRDEKEVVPALDCDAPVDDGAGRGVGVLPGVLFCNSGETKTFVSKGEKWRT